MNDPDADDSSAAGGDLIAGWFDGFRASAHFERLSEAHRKRAWGVIDLFARYSVDYTGESPGQWSAGGVRKCCLEILPRKVTGDDALFQAVAPVLSAFFIHLDEQQLLKRGRALAEMVTPLDRQIVANAGDSRNWGMAKSLMMQALEAGVDLNNQEELSAHFLKVNAALLAQQPEKALREAAPAAVVPDYTPKLPVRREEPKVGRNDPCPCGSGKKYKKCCLEHRAASPVPLVRSVPPAPPAQERYFHPHTFARMSDDPKSLELAGAIVRRDLSHRWSPKKVAALSTENIEARVQDIGVPYVRAEFMRFTQEFRSGWDLSAVWRDRFPNLDRMADDFLGLAACELWKRLCPERPSLEMIDDWMQDGYDLVGHHKPEEALETWMRAWGALRPWFTPDMRRVSEADRRVFPGMTHLLFNWVRDVSMEALNGSVDDRVCAEIGIRFIGELLETFPDEDGDLHFRADAATMHFHCGRAEEGERLCLKLIAEHPDRAAGYVGLADELGSQVRRSPRPADVARAIALLEQALARPVADAKEYDLARRLKECRARTGLS